MNLRAIEKAVNSNKCFICGRDLQQHKGSLGYEYIMCDKCGLYIDSFGLHIIGITDKD
ncbi:MAG: hypothetical protein PWQ43_741 [Rikenellaceae bacterium]|nr:hypothetical protein [Rikenellaceae bacterium]